MTKTNAQNEIKEITRQIVENYRPEKIILFGSSATGDFKADSDLDFVIIKENVPDLGLDRMREVRRLVQKNIAADFLVYKPEEFRERERLGDPFIRSILKEGKVLYGG